MMSALSLIPSGRGFAVYLYGYVYLQLRSVKGPILDENRAGHGAGLKSEIISFIENGEVIQTILKHLGIWLVRSRPPPKIHAPPTLLESESTDRHPHLSSYLKNAERKTA
jgi:hypothetical protein